MLNFDDLIQGYESVDLQTDKQFIFDSNIILDNIISDMYRLIDKRDALKFKIGKDIKNTLNSVYKNLSGVLTERFNFNINIKHKDTDTILYSIYPNYSYDNVIKAVDNFKEMYPDKDSVMNNITKDKLTLQAIESMDMLQSAINSDLLSIDLKEAKIYGIENTTMNMYINIKYVLDRGISSIELMSLILKEIGMFFKDISKINSTYSNNLSLLTSLRKLNPDNINKNKLTVLLNSHITGNIQGDSIISIINDFNINYKNDINNLIELEDKSELDFVSSFSLGDNLSSAIVKANTIKHYREFKSITGDAFKLVFMVIMLYVIMVTLLFINVFLGLGVMVVLSVNAIIAFLDILFKTSFNILTLIFKSSGDETVNIIEVIKSIEHIKHDLNYSLRNKDGDKNSILKQISNINIVLKNLDELYRFSNRIEMKDKLYKQGSTLIENLNGNDLHYLAEKIKKD